MIQLVQLQYTGLMASLVQLQLVCLLQKLAARHLGGEQALLHEARPAALVGRDLGRAVRRVSGRAELPQPEAERRLRGRQLLDLVHVGELRLQHRAATNPAVARLRLRDQRGNGGRVSHLSQQSCEEQGFKDQD